MREAYEASKWAFVSNVWIGLNVVILRGSRIGDHDVIGAGCVIKGEILPYSVVTSKENLQVRKYELNH